MPVPNINKPRDETRPGRPKGSKTKTTPIAFQNRFKGKTMENIAKLLEDGDRETTLKCAQIFWNNKTMPGPAINLVKIVDAETAKKALAQVIRYTAEGKISGDHADRLIAQIKTWLELTEYQTLRAQLLERGLIDER